MTTIPIDTISPAVKVVLLSLWQPALVIGVSAALGAKWFHNFPSTLWELAATSLFGLVAAIPLTWGLFLVHRRRPIVAYLFAVFLSPLSTALLIGSAVIGLLAIVAAVVIMPMPVWIALLKMQRRSG